MADLRPIGIFDSGVGGVSVLREAVRQLPSEDFIYYGDTLHAPYGVKEPKEICRLAAGILGMLLNRGAKAVVIACNTATSAAGAYLRSEYPSLPIIGMEPALKPASLIRREGLLLVMATPVTLSLPKFQRLMELYGQGAVPLPCPGLMDFVENGELGGEKLNAYLESRFAPFQGRLVDAVVLGCTHYVFLREAIQRFFPPQTPVIDGNLGTVRQLERRLFKAELLSPANRNGTVQFLTSGDPERVIPRMERLLAAP